MPREHTQEEWDDLMNRFPPGTPISGHVVDRQLYGVWVSLDELPEVLALLEIIHFEIVESEPKHRIQFPDDYPAIGTPLKTRVLGWSLKPKDVRLTQLSHIDWCHHHRRTEV
jgi:hypothetical protein